MNKILSILRLEFLPASTDVALLVLRLWAGLSLLALHGWAKLSNYQQMSRGFSDPLKVGSQTSLTLAVIGEVVCPLLVIFGVFARLGALGSATTMGVAFFLVHNAKLKGPGNGELAFIYMMAFVAILIAGPGRYAIDGKRGKSAVKKPRPGNE